MGIINPRILWFGSDFATNARHTLESIPPLNPMTIPFEFLGFSLLQVNIVESSMILIGFIMIMYSIYGIDWGSNFP